MGSNEQLTISIQEVLKRFLHLLQSLQVKPMVAQTFNPAFAFPTGFAMSAGLGNIIWR